MDDLTADFVKEGISIFMVNHTTRTHWNIGRSTVSHMTALEDKGQHVLVLASPGATSFLAPEASSIVAAPIKYSGVISSLRSFLGARAHFYRHPYLKPASYCLLNEILSHVNIKKKTPTGREGDDNQPNPMHD